MINGQPEFSFDSGKLPSKQERAFWEFHQVNPHVYLRLVKLAREWHERRRAKIIGIATVFETARYQFDMETESGDGFKLNNNHRAYYARLIMRDESDLSEIFRLREQKIDSTI